MRVPDGHTESCALERVPYDQPGAGHGSRCHDSICHPAWARESACHEGMGWVVASFWSLRRDLTVFTRQPALSLPRYGARPQVSGLGGTCVLSFQSCLTLRDPVDCSLPGSTIHGILQVRILEWVVMPSSRGSSEPRDWTCVSYIFCIGRQVPYH